MSFLHSAGLAGDLASPFDQAALGAEEGLGLLDDYLEVATPWKPPGPPGDKAAAGFSEWLAADGLPGASADGKEDAFSGTDWMLEKVDLKEFDFDALLSLDDLETVPDELLASLDDSCDLFAPLALDALKELPQAGSPLGPLPASLPQVAPCTFLQPLPLSLGVAAASPDESFSLELGSEVDIADGDRKPESPGLGPVVPQSVKEEDSPSDNDSGVCMSPESYPGSPQRSPSASTPRVSPLRGPPAPTRPKPYEPAAAAAARVKGEKLEKKLKKMEQNKTAATRYRQKKRAEQEALAGECRGLEERNAALRERADGLAKEIQYLKDLLEEVRAARGRRRVPA
ncbi:cyclic AMP-dependent transcription factor ATF-4 [Lepus europaeus]|uniref:cyclic AMP-dependent transcription factor ATF-4 n=1 Tax=Lepus europaeus TaxID=9983 RepID=UPI002B479D01|nr:cyclic AMP-dependent transcription factor ATF-4 [Lepus europaeus]